MWWLLQEAACRGPCQCRPRCCCCCCCFLLLSNCSPQALQVGRVPLKLHDCSHQVEKPKVRPQHGREGQQRVAALPEQEVGEARLAAGTHQQVNRGASCRVEVPLQGWCCRAALQAAGAAIYSRCFSRCCCFW